MKSMILMLLALSILLLLNSVSAVTDISTTISIGNQISYKFPAIDYPVAPFDITIPGFENLDIYSANSILIPTNNNPTGPTNPGDSIGTIDDGSGSTIDTGSSGDGSTIDTGSSGDGSTIDTGSSGDGSTIDTGSSGDGSTIDTGSSGDGSTIDTGCSGDGSTIDTGCSGDGSATSTKVITIAVSSTVTSSGESEYTENTTISEA